jgi:hypothetical protein
MAGVSISTRVQAAHGRGLACAAYQDKYLRDLDCKVIEADEIWSLVAHEERNKPGELKAPSAQATYGPGPRSKPTPS